MIDTTHRAGLTRGRVLGLGLGALLAGVALSAAPAMASTLSTCTYNPSNKNVIITDHSGSATLRVFTDSGVIRIEDVPGNFVTCKAGNLGELARVTNTDRIAIFAAPADVVGGFHGGYLIDQNNGRFAPGATKETDSDSEIEITLDTTGVPAVFTVAGTPQRDVMSIGTGGRINFSYDSDADIVPLTQPEFVELSGGLGNDELDSNGGGIFSEPSDVFQVALEGDGDNDTLVLGPRNNSPLDRALGGFGDDRLYSVDGGGDVVGGGPGLDVATVDSHDRPVDNIEQKIVASNVGRLQFTPTALDARAGKPVQLKLSGKTVTADLAVRLNDSLAGGDVRVDVQATDRKGHTQLEPQAGVIRVAK